MTIGGTVIAIERRPAVSLADRRQISLAIAVSLVAELARVEPEAIAITARCHDCGGPHGQRVVTAPEQARFVRLSNSYAGDVIVVAASSTTIGIDAETRADAAAKASAIDDVAGPSSDPLLHWTRVEAVLKALGTGLRRDPRDVRIDGSTAFIDGRSFDLVELRSPDDLRVTLATEVAEEARR